MPSSVAMRRRPRLLRPVTFCEPGVYRVGGISSQENKVSSTASIFISSSRALPLLFRPSINRRCHTASKSNGASCTDGSDTSPP